MAATECPSAPAAPPTSVLDLAPETLALVLEFVEVGDTQFFIGTNLKSLCNASLVCRGWRDVSQRQLAVHQFYWGPEGTRRVGAYLASDLAGRYPVQHLEVLGIAVPMGVMDQCGGLRALTLEGIKGLDGDFFHHPHLSNLKRLSLGGVRVADSPLASTPTSIQLTYLSTDLITMPESLFTLFQSSAATLTTLRVYLSSPRDTVRLVTVFQHVAPTLRILDFHAHLPSPELHSLITQCTRLTTLSVKGAEAYKPLVLLARSLPPTIRRLTFHRELPSFALESIVSILQMANMDGVRQIDFPFVSAATLAPDLDVGVWGELPLVTDGRRLKDICETKGIRIAYKEDLF